MILSETNVRRIDNSALVEIKCLPTKNHYLNSALHCAKKNTHGTVSDIVDTSDNVRMQIIHLPPDGGNVRSKSGVYEKIDC